MTQVKSPLTIDLQIACEIYKFNINNEKIWFKKIEERFNDISKKRISKAIDTLFDWGILKAEYGPTEEGKEGRLYFISKEATPLIKDLYKHYWN